MKPITVIGGGLAGCEAALQLAGRGSTVKLWEMRPDRKTPAHKTGLLAELVCSNSLKSSEPNNAHGLLKEELRRLGCALLSIAEETRVPAGKSLAVDRLRFAQAVTMRVSSDPHISIERKEAVDVPNEPCIIASGPLTSESLVTSLSGFLGRDTLYFYDAIAPIINADSIDFSEVFRGARYGVDDSYVNCPLDRETYERFVGALVDAKTTPVHDFETGLFFQGCLPIEETVRRGRDSLRFGALKPVGFDRRDYAVLQLRPENLDRTMYSLVGCQTKMVIAEQERVFRMIPGLGQAHFLRYGSAHRNTYVNAPECLRPTMQVRARDDVFLAGQLSGVEGYVESIATGLLASINLHRTLAGREAVVPPRATVLGGLVEYLSTPHRDFAPMNVNFGLVPAARNRAEIVATSLKAIEKWIAEANI